MPLAHEIELLSCRGLDWIAMALGFRIEGWKPRSADRPEAYPPFHSKDLSLTYISFVHFGDAPHLR